MSNNFKLLTELFAKTFKREEFPNPEIAKNYQEYLASSLQGFLVTEMAEPNSAASLLQYIIESFKMRKELYEEGISLIGSIFHYTKSDFKALM